MKNEAASQTAIEDVVTRFLTAIGRGDREEAFRCCIKDAYESDIDMLLACYKRRPPQGFLQFEAGASTPARAVALVCFADPRPASFIKPNFIIRLVLEMSTGEWRIRRINYLEEFLPTVVSWEPDVEMALRDESVFTDTLEYVLETRKPVRFAVHYDTGNEYDPHFFTGGDRMVFAARLPEFFIRFPQPGGDEGTTVYCVGPKAVQVARQGDVYNISITRPSPSRGEGTWVIKTSLPQRPGA